LALLDNKHRPLFLGRQARVASVDQRLALIAADRGCSRPGCDQPATRTAVHHVTEWSKGGRTDITALVLVCDGDHAQIHDGEHGWITEIITDRTGPPGWHGRIGWRQRGTADPLQVNNTHFPDKYFTHPQMWHPDSDADAEWFRQRAREELDRTYTEPPIRTIDFGWPKPVAA
jgi:hypothetical protein